MNQKDRRQWPREIIKPPEPGELEMSEIKLNLITREWVIIGIERCKKIEDFAEAKEEAPRVSFNMSLLPRNESRTPDESYRIGDEKSWKYGTLL